ncbi:MAG: ABC-type branched-subunit amino acid transport system substrate-binding protein [Verrucomicrobiales bacterium]|jgi:ABC-type branched-subunit amino acid transport system substrate-binding protein
MLVFLAGACSSGEVPELGAKDEPTTVPASEVVVAEDVVATTTTQPVVDEPSELFDFGVTNSSIRVGLSLDLQGSRSAVDAVILDAHLAYFDIVNAAGGIAGRDVDIVALNHASSLDAHVDNLAQLAENSEQGVVLVGSAGSGEFADAGLPILQREGLAAVLQGAAQTVADGSSGVLEIGRTTCVDTVDGVSGLLTNVDLEAPTLAIIARDGAYGQSSREAAEWVAQQLGSSVVMSTDDVEELDDVVERLVEASPDLVWVAVSPRELGLLAGAVQNLEFDWRWSGTPQSYDAGLLEVAAAELLDERYTHVASIAPYGLSDSSTRDEMIAEAFPDVRYRDADSLTLGWQQAEAVHEMLLLAAEAGDLTRASLTSIVSERARSVELTSRFFEIDLEVAAIDVVLAAEGSTGLIEIDRLSTPVEGASPCE